VNFQTSKNFSGIGAILLLVSFFAAPFTSIFGSGAIGIIGLILMLVGIRGLADYYRDDRIFNNALYGSITGVVGVVVTAATAFIGFLSAAADFFGKVFPGWNGDWRSLSGMTPDTSNITLSDVAPFIAIFLAVILIAFIFALVTALFYRKSLLNLKDKTSVGLFGSASLLLLVGGALSIILIGYVLMWIALLLVAIAFFQMKQPMQEPQAPPTPAY
jgi:uncharacterized membrane protein